jgi:hypothetical protein
MNNPDTRPEAPPDIQNPGLIFLNTLWKIEIYRYNNETLTAVC